MSYEFWQKALAGKSVTIHENDPQPGFYRVRRKGEPWEPVAIWLDDAEGKMIAKRGDTEVDASELWTWACRNPISHELYKAVRDGKPWPEDVTAEVEAAKAEIGHNSAAAPHEEIADEIDAATKAFDMWLAGIGGKVSDEDQDAKAETFRTRLHALGKKAEDARTEEKKPILEAGRKVDATWKPVVDAAEAGKKRIGSVVVSYRVARDKRRQEEEAKRRAEEQAAIAKAAAEAAKMAEATGNDPAEAAAEAAATARVTQQAQQPSGFVAKPKQGFRNVEICVLDDAVKAAASILSAAPTQPDIIDAIRKVAHRMLKAGATVEGARLTTEQRV